METIAKLLEDAGYKRQPQTANSIHTFQREHSKGYLCRVKLQYIKDQLCFRVSFRWTGGVKPHNYEVTAAGDWRVLQQETDIARILESRDIMANNLKLN